MKQKKVTRNKNVGNNIITVFIHTGKEGITLISLVITIIVLLILATVAISIAIDSDGLFTRARKAAEDWNTSVANEKKAIENVFEILNEVNVGGTVGGGEMQPPTVEVKSITLTPQTLKLMEGENGKVTATINPDTATDQDITWNSESDGVATVEKNGKVVTVTAVASGSTEITANCGGRSATCSVTVTSKGANEPAMPGETKFEYVTWKKKDGSDTYEEVLTSKEEGAPEGWYDYDNQKWANLKTTSGDGENVAYWVWIPRYAYQVPEKPTSKTSTDNPPEFQIVFLQGNTNTPVNEGDIGEEEIKTAEDLNGSAPSIGDWVVHPAFDFGGTPLSGIWVAKFEASSSNPSAENGGGNDPNLKVNVKPNISGQSAVCSWRYITVNNIFTVCQAMDDAGGVLEGIENADPHMMKNVEWGAVVYLAQSKYGKKGQVWNNPNSTFLTGQAGSTADDSNYSSTNDYNTGNGPQASTTGNVYGIYDMAGGAWEYVAAYVNNSNSTNYTNKLLGAADKYKDSYKVGSSDNNSTNYEKNKNKYGDAVYETSYQGTMSTSWQKDYSYFPRTSTPIFIRGGSYNEGTIAGVFYFNIGNGNFGTNYSFRPVWVVQ